MQISGLPTRTSVPFANGGTKNVIPTAASPTPGLASYATGFTPLNMTPIVAGGIPPSGADFNGILNAITTAVQWENAGGRYAYDATFSAAVGGYPKGALLASGAYNGLWLCLADNNTTNPDAGGANWFSIPAFATVQQGGGTGQSTNKVYIGLGGSRLKATVDTSDFGNIVFDGNTSTETTVGVLKIATQALTNAGVDDTTAVTPKKMRLGFSISLGSTGFIGFPTWMGGLMIQWGQATLSGAAITLRVTLPTVFPTNNLWGISSDTGSTGFPSAVSPVNTSQSDIFVAQYVGNTGTLAAKNGTAIIRYLMLGN